MKYSTAFFALLVLFGFHLYAQHPGFFLDDWKPKYAEIPPYKTVEKSLNKETIHIKIDTGQVLHKVPTHIYGNNAVTWDNGLPKNNTAMKDLKNLNPQVLRWPGGNLSNNYFWNLAADQRPGDIPANMDPWYGQNTADWQMSVDEYYELLEETNSTGIICVNYSYARYGTGPNPVAKAAHMAAEWVRYDNGRSKFWEIGNENYGNWQAGYKIDVSKNQDGQPEFISGKLYGQHCKVFIDSMRKAAAEIGVDIKIGVVAYDAETSHDAISEVWNEGMMPEVGDLADFLIVHSYFTPYNQNSGVSTILNSHDVPEEIMSVIVSDMNEAGKPMIPVAMTEWNIFAVGSMQQVSYINGMLAALTLGEFIRNNYGLATRWDLVNGWNGGDDHGMFSVGGEPGVDAYNPRAVFFYMYYFQKYFGDRMVQLTQTGSNQVVSYASTFSSGETGLVIINKSSVNETVSVEFEQFQPGARYYYHTLTGGVDNDAFSRKVLINGVETDEQGGGPDNYESISAHASRTRGGITVDLPPLSVVYVLIDKKPPLSYVSSKVDTNASVITVELSEEVLPFENPVGFEVKVNDALVTFTGVERDTSDSFNLMVFLENDLTNDDTITLSYSGSNIVSFDSIPLHPFTDTLVSNMLPGDPVNIEFIAKNSESGMPVENCLIEFNEKTYYTDVNGTVLINEPEGQYLLNAAKRHLKPLVNQQVNISSDTVITLMLDSAKYQVALQVFDHQTGNILTFIDVNVNTGLQEKSSNGEALIELTAGNYTITVQSRNYHDLVTQHTIESDTSLKVSLERSTADVRFQLKNGTQPIKEALVVFNKDSLCTNLLGMCTFESVTIETVIDYQVQKHHFFPVSGSAEVTTDTTIELQVEKSVANMTFHVTMENGFLQNAYAVVREDTVWLDDKGFGRFFNLEKNQKYTFSVKSDNSPVYIDSVFLMCDTAINVLLVATDIEDEHMVTQIAIYPNPASSELHVKMISDIHQLQIVNTDGKLVMQSKKTPKTNIQVVDISGLPEGVYFIRCLSQYKNQWLTYPFVIRR